MRIAQFNAAPVTGASGGMEKVFINLANRLAGRGHEVGCFYFDKKGKPFYPVDSKVYLKNCKDSLWARIRIGLAQLSTLVQPDRATRRNIRNYIKIKLLRKHLEKFKPDVVICYVPFPSLQELGVNNAPVLLMLHSNPDLFMAERTEAERESMERCDVIQVLMPEFIPSLRKAVRNPHVVCIPNIVPQYEEASDCTRKKIIFVGRIAEQKRPELVVSSFSLLRDKYPDWSVELWGDCSNETALTEKLRDSIRTLHLEKRVLLCGTTANIPDKLKDSSIMLLPSAYEGFSLAAAEGMSMGLPAVVCADCPSLNTLVRDGENGFLCDPTPEGIAAKLDLLMGDEVLRKKLGAQAHEDMKQYSAESVCDQWENLLKQAIKTKNKSLLVNEKVS